MKDLIKMAAVGVAGYLIGFYEMKYKVAKTLVEVYIDKEKENDSDKMEDSTEMKKEEA